MTRSSRLSLLILGTVIFRQNTAVTYVIPINPKHRKEREAFIQPIIKGSSICQDLNDISYVLLWNIDINFSLLSYVWIFVSDLQSKCENKRILKKRISRISYNSEQDINGIKSNQIIFIQS